MEHLMLQKYKKTQKKLKHYSYFLFANKQNKSILSVVLKQKVTEKKMAKIRNNKVLFYF